MSAHNWNDWSRPMMSYESTTTSKSRDQSPKPYTPLHISRQKPVVHKAPPKEVIIIYNGTPESRNTIKELTQHRTLETLTIISKPEDNTPITKDILDIIKNNKALKDISLQVMYTNDDFLKLIYALKHSKIQKIKLSPINSNQVAFVGYLITENTYITDMVMEVLPFYDEEPIYVEEKAFWKLLGAIGRSALEFFSSSNYIYDVKLSDDVIDHIIDNISQNKWIEFLTLRNDMWDENLYNVLTERINNVLSNNTTNKKSLTISLISSL